MGNVLRLVQWAIQQGYQVLVTGEDRIVIERPNGDCVKVVRYKLESDLGHTYDIYLRRRGAKRWSWCAEAKGFNYAKSCIIEALSELF